MDKANTEKNSNKEIEPSVVRPTKKQQEILDFIRSFTADNNYSPSYREIMSGCGYSSVATVAGHINNLVTRGHLIKRENSARSLEVLSSKSEEEQKRSNEEVVLGVLEAKISSPNINEDEVQILVKTLDILGLELKDS